MPTDSTLRTPGAGSGHSARSARIGDPFGEDEHFFTGAGNLSGRGGIYQGWKNVLLSLLVVLVVTGTTAYSFGLFIKPVSAEFGLSRATTNLGLVLFHLGSALYSPFTGRLLDRFAILKLLRVSAVLFGGGLIGLGFARSPALMGLLIVGPVAMGSALSGSLFASVMVSRWFSVLRGRALTISAMGTSLGGMIVFPTVAALMANFGWRVALIATGGGAFAVLILVSLLARDRPPHARPASRVPPVVAQDDAAPSPESVRLTPWQVLGIRDFWFIALAVSLLLGVDQALLATVTPYAQDRGFSLAEAAGMMTAITGSAIVGKLLIAWLADRVDLRLLLVLTAVCSLLMCVALTFDPSYPLMFVTACLTGLAIGGTYPIGSTMMSRRFGAATVGTALGLKVPLVGAAAMSTLYFVGAMHDRFGSYRVGFLSFAAIAVLAIVLAPFIRLPPPPMRAISARAD